MLTKNHALLKVLHTRKYRLPLASMLPRMDCVYATVANSDITHTDSPHEHSIHRTSHSLKSLYDPVSRPA